MTIIGAVQTYLRSYTELKTNAPVWVDHLGPQPTEYSIVPLPGGGVIEQYLSGSSLRQFQFAFQSMESTADDLERLNNSGFFEALSEWFESQTEEEDLPSLGTGKKATAIEALGWAFLYQQGQSDTGIYMIQCRMVYLQDAP